MCHRSSQMSCIERVSNRQDGGGLALQIEAGRGRAKEEEVRDLKQLARWPCLYNSSVFYVCCMFCFFLAEVDHKFQQTHEVPARRLQSVSFRFAEIIETRALKRERFLGEVELLLLIWKVCALCLLQSHPPPWLKQLTAIR